MANCVLIGGETAEMKGIYLKDKLDIAGFSVGEIIYDLPKKNLMNNECILYGIPSSGIHSNGYTLVRELLEKNEVQDFAIDETSDTFKLSNPSGITSHEKSLRRKIGLPETSSGIDRRTTRETLMRQQKEQDDQSLVKYQGFELVEDKQKSTRDRDDHLDSRKGRSDHQGFDQDNSDDDHDGNDSDQGAFDALLGVREF